MTQDRLDSLERLGALFDAGRISSDEYAELKRSIMDVEPHGPVVQSEPTKQPVVSPPPSQVPHESARLKFRVGVVLMAAGVAGIIVSVSMLESSSALEFILRIVLNPLVWLGPIGAGLVQKNQERVLGPEIRIPNPDYRPSGKKPQP